MSETMKIMTTTAKLRRPPELEPLTKYGNLRLQYLEEQRPDLYNEYFQDGELYQHCLEVQSAAEIRLRSMMKQYEAHNPPPNHNTDGLAWAAHMGMLKRSVEEIIYAELIYE